MPKLELKPWKVGEPQIVWISKDGKRRIKLILYETLYEEEGTWSFQVLNGGVWEYKDIHTVHWAEMARDLLGIPETIEGEERG